MTRAIRLLVLVSVVTTMWGRVSAAEACTCVNAPSLCGQRAADAIFIGRVTSATDGRVEVSVLGTFKGLDAARTVELPSGDEGMCGYEFDVGQTYLIFADRTLEGALTTGLCDGNKPLSQVSVATLEDLEDLRRGFGRTELFGVLYGRRTADGASPLRGIRVTATRNGKRFSATTNRRGEYRISVREPGDYTVDAALPDSLTLARRFAGGPPSATAIAHACVPVELDVRNNAVILGRLIAPAGVDVQRIPVQIRSLDGTGGMGAYTDPVGRFEIAGIEPGEYVLGINTGCGPTVRYPYAATVFPGVTDESAARRYRIDGPVRIENQDLPFRGLETPTAISVTATGEDGRPIAGAGIGVFAECGRHEEYEPVVPTDANGHATLQVFESKTWNVFAGAQIGEGAGGQLCAPRVRIERGSVPESLHFALSRRACPGVWNERALRLMTRTHPGDYRFVKARAVSSDGRSLEGVSISVSRNGRTLVQLTTEDGGSVDLPVPRGETVTVDARYSTCESRHVEIDGPGDALRWRRLVSGPLPPGLSFVPRYYQTEPIEFVFGAPGNECRPLAPR